MPIFSDNIRTGSSNASTDYEIERSLRFNGETDDAYLKRTSVSSVTNQKIWTMSLWIKRDGTVNGNDMELLFGNDYNTGSVSTRGFQFAVGRNDFKIETFDGASGMGTNISAGSYRDPTAWMHIVVQCDTTQGTQSNRMRVYTNGTDIGLGNSLSQNQNITWNKASREQYLGSHAINGGATRFFRGYIAEAHFVDGQSLDPTNFAETDATTGYYKPIEYAGTYGNNGWYLAFTDNSNTTSTTLGKDSSGNGNNFTPNNFATTDAVKDSPTNNFCTINPNDKDPDTRLAISDGNLKVFTSHGFRTARATFGLSSGKWYWEARLISWAHSFIGITDTEEDITSSTRGGETSNSATIRQNNGNLRTNGGDSSYGTSQADGDILGFALDMDNGKFYIAKNNSWFNSGDPANGTNPGKTGLTATVSPSAAPYDNKSCFFNFGQDDTFDGNETSQGNTDANGLGVFKYAPPTGFLAICSENLPDPTILLPNQHFNTKLYTGNSTDAREITEVGFAPDLVWIKNRDDTDWNNLYDTVRGAGKRVSTNSTSAEHDSTDHMDSIDSDGFTLKDGDNTNQNGEDYVSWNWNAGGTTVTNTDGDISAQVRANTTAGFSIVKYSGSGNVSDTVGHGLNVNPAFITIKQRTGTYWWRVYHSYYGTNATQGLFLNATNGSYTHDNIGGIKAITSTTFGFGTNGTNDLDGVNKSSNDYIAYCFSEVAGYSKFGSYTGSGNADGTFVFTGFRPAWVLIKSTSGSTHWVIKDTARDTYNVANKTLLANSNTTEDTSSSFSIDFLSNGFKSRTSGTHVNANGTTYIYLAFAESPFKYSRAR